ncbi:phospholipid carrier-dependent glycosyltransferase [Patescibacteria group bacterium]
MSYKFKILVAGLVFLFLGIFIFNNLKKEVLHEDEWFFIRRAEFFNLFFIKKDFNNELWFGFHGLDQPYISYYYYGLVFHLSGISDIKTVLEKVDFEQKMPMWDKNGKQKQDLWKHLYQRQYLPSEFQDKFDLIIKGRRGAAVLLLICSFLFFLILAKTIGFWWAVLGVLLFNINPITNEYGRKALGDQPLLFFLLLTPLLTMLLLKQKSIKKLLFGFILLGINCGLAIGTKLNGAVTYIFSYLMVMAYLLIKPFPKNSKAKKYWFIAPFIIGVITLLVFYIFHPSIWQEPFSGFLKFIGFRIRIVEIQAGIWPDTSLIGNWGTRFVALYQQLFYLPFKIDFYVFILGLLISINRLYNSWKNKKFTEFSVFTFYSLVLFICFYFYNSLNWQRYYWVLVTSVIFFQLNSLKILQNMILSKDRKNEIFTAFYQNKKTSSKR